MVTLRNSIWVGREAGLETTLQKIKKAVGHKEIEKVCLGHFCIRESEKQCLLERAMRSQEW